VSAKPAGKIRVTLLKGLRGCKQSHRDTVRGLGLRRIDHTVELQDTPAVRGMVRKVGYLVRIED
jgi:large subunit ribosomal protein L30